MPEKFFYNPTEWLCSLCGCDRVQWIGMNSKEDDIYYCPECDSKDIKVVTRRSLNERI
jgi:Zn finger protein HypA/HybF involved in hydrogenase expression